MHSEICVLHKTFHLKREQAPLVLRISISPKPSTGGANTWQKDFIDYAFRMWFKLQIEDADRNPVGAYSLTSLKLISAGLAVSLLEDCGEAEVSNRLIYDDERKYGRIPTRMYWLYLISCGPRMVAIFFLSALAQQALKVYTDFWLQEWTDQTTTVPAEIADGQPPKPIEIQHHFHAYVALSAVCIVLAAISVPAGQRAGSNARRRLHRELIASVLQNSIHFFQSVPLGRIMNRLSIDVAVVDKVRTLAKMALDCKTLR
uniref:ABC transmembrane type-1 domain-containing protein n=1 Tax=Anopheles maculatus TaxID=74869 RepID=A0A182T5T3_9DIPT